MNHEPFHAGVLAEQAITVPLYSGALEIACPLSCAQANAYSKTIMVLEAGYKGTTGFRKVVKATGTCISTLFEICKEQNPTSSAG
jgi:hypothetical protein